MRKTRDRPGLRRSSPHNRCPLLPALKALENLTEPASPMEIAIKLGSASEITTAETKVRADGRMEIANMSVQADGMAMADIARIQKRTTRNR